MNISSADSNADYVTKLENEVHEMTDSREIHEKSNKDELQRTYRWTEADLMFSEQVITFTKEYLFPIQVPEQRVG